MLDLLRSPRTVRLLLAALVVVGGALVLTASRDGLGTTPDGVSYLGAAENVADGRGLTGPFSTALDPFTPEEAAAFDGAVPFIQWPPGYPALLAVGTVVGVDAVAVARVVNAVAYGLLLALVGWIAASLAPVRWSSGAAGAAIAAVALVGVQPYVALLSVLVASEPTYLVLSLGAAWCFVRWAARSDRTGAIQVDRLLVAAFALASLGALTRFVGLSLVAALGLALVVLGGGSLVRRVGTVAVAMVAAAAPAVAWSLVVGRQAGTSVRTLAWHPPDEPQWRLAVSSVQEWVVPADASTPWRWVLTLLAVQAAVIAAWGWQQAVKQGEPDGLARPWLVTTALVVGAYLAAVVATHSLVDRVVPLGQRLFTPIVPFVVLTVAVGVVHAIHAARTSEADQTRESVDVDGRQTPTTSTDSALGVGAGAGVRAAPTVTALVVVLGLSGSWWDLAEPGRPWPPDPATTPTGQYLNDLDPGVLVVANDPSLAWQTARRQTIAMPVRTSAPTGLDNPRFDEEVRQVGDLVRAREGVAVVYGLAAYVNPHTATTADLEAIAGLEVVATFNDAVVLRAPPG